MTAQNKDWTFKVVAVLVMVGGFVVGSWALDDRIDNKIKCTTGVLSEQLKESATDRARMREALARIEEKLTAIDRRFEYLQSRTRNEK